MMSAAEVQAFPSGFRVQEIEIDGAVLHVRVGGSGSAGVAPMGGGVPR